MKFKKPNTYPGFSLAELLIALAVLGIVAAFTIPKLMSPEKKLNERYSKAMETAGALSSLTKEYLRQNNGCFPGNLTCKVDPISGIQLDGGPFDGSRLVSGPGNSSYEAFNDYLTAHLNHIRKSRWGGISYLYYLPNNITIASTVIGRSGMPRNGQYGIDAVFFIFLDRTPEQVNANQFSAGGVDAHTTILYIGQSGSVILGEVSRREQEGFPYAPGTATIFDWPYHPGDTCTVVGGLRCDIQ